MRNQNQTHVLICLDGEPPHQRTLYRELKGKDCVIAADGGANWLFDNNIAPDVLIGDLDGVKKKPNRGIHYVFQFQSLIRICSVSPD